MKMSHPVVVLPEIVTVRALICHLESNSHNGFPVVRAKERAFNTLGKTRSTLRISGLILRRQLLVLLKCRVWTYQKTGAYALPKNVQHKFINSYEEGDKIEQSLRSAGIMQVGLMSGGLEKAFEFNEQDLDNFTVIFKGPLV